MEAISLISSSSALAVAPRAIVPTGSGKCHRLQAFSRAAGASLVGGNSIRLLKDARENYPAWLDAIARARRSIHFESYIIHEDAVGEQFGDALIAKARDGLRVRVIYDWMGGFGRTSRRFWRRLRAGGEPCGRRRVTASMSGSWCRMEPTSRCYALSPEPATGRCWKPGVRVFEWRGPMLHAKTAVADGRWARVGSINLSIASWLGNYELDVVAEDRPFAGLMETMYLEDLANSTEVLDSRHRVNAPRSEGVSRTGEARAAPPAGCFGSVTRSAPPSPITACSSPSRTASCWRPPCCF